MTLKMLREKIEDIFFNWIEIIVNHPLTEHHWKVYDTLSDIIKYHICVHIILSPFTNCFLFYKTFQMKDRVTKFEKFIKENEAKRRRAIQKYQNEVKLREQKSTECTMLSEELEKVTSRSAILLFNHISPNILNSYAAGGLFGQYKSMQKTWKMAETLAKGYSSESAQRELSNEYQHDRV